MFSLDRFYNVIHNNLISKFTNGKSIYFWPFGTYEFVSILNDNFDYKETNILRSTPIEKSFFHCYFFDQEPILDYTLSVIEKPILFNTDTHTHGPRQISIFANSEHSKIKNLIVKKQGYYDWYYFYHGFAALDWYRDFQYVNQNSFNRYSKVFICYNHLTSNLRSYRLHLASNLINQDLTKYGYLSLFLKDQYGTWQDTINDPLNPLDRRAVPGVIQALSNLSEPLIIDTPNPQGSLSAQVNLDQLTSALWHVVTETIYFDTKLHLTEKIFKPIVAKRPFILVAAPGNLAYLKSYGFKTFDRWIDESYDQEQDHYIRIEKITSEIAKLCELSPTALKAMHIEMQEVLEYNFNHFYTTFKDLIIDELVDNFEHILCQINNGRQPGNHSKYHQRFELSPEYLLEVKTRLKQ
jgi:hypothetical protein